MAMEYSNSYENYFERRWALVEIDVIMALHLDLPLDGLILIYNVQFPVLHAKRR